MFKEKYLYIHKEQKIIEALDKINKNRKQFILIVTKEFVLEGILTDGDIRRGILNGFKVNDKINDIMNTNPLTALDTESNQKIELKMKEKKVMQCPIVDKKNKVIRIKYLNDQFHEYKETFSRNKKDNYIVIMAGGVGSRLKPLTNIKPKAMVIINEKPMLEELILNLKKYGFSKIILSVNHKAKMIKDYFKDGSTFGVNIQYIEEEKKLGTAGSLSYIAKENLKESIIVMNCDVVTNVNFLTLLNFHKKTKSNATMCVKDYQIEIPFGVVETNNDEVIGLLEKPSKSFFINAGIYVLEEKAVSLVPKNSFYNMTDLFQELIRLEMNPKTFPIIENWMDVGNYEDIKNFNKF